MLDQHTRAHNPQALGMATALADWVAQSVEGAVARGGIAKWQGVLNTEWGGMNDVRGASREAFCAQSTRMYACLLAHGLVCVALPRYSVRRPYNSNLVAFSLHSIHPQLDLGNLHLSVYLCVICSHACTRARARTHICLGPLPSVPDHRQPETPRGRKTIQSLAMDGAACSWAGCFRRLKRQRWRQSCQHPHSRGGWDRTWVRGYGKFDPKEHCDQFFQHIDRRRGRAVESCSSRRSFLRYWRLQCCRTLVWCIHVGRHAAVSWPLMAFPSLRLCLSPSLYG